MYYLTPEFFHGFFSKFDPNTEMNRQFNSNVEKKTMAEKREHVQTVLTQSISLELILNFNCFHFDIVGL